jgi:hypothetical protein
MPRGELPSAAAAARRVEKWVLGKLGDVDSSYVRVLWWGGRGVCNDDEKRLNTKPVRRGPRGRAKNTFFPTPVRYFVCVSPTITRSVLRNLGDPPNRLQHARAPYVSVFLQLALPAVRIEHRAASRMSSKCVVVFFLVFCVRATSLFR